MSEQSSGHPQPCGCLQCGLRRASEESADRYATLLRVHQQCVAALKDAVLLIESYKTARHSPILISAIAALAEAKKLEVV